MKSINVMRSWLWFFAAFMITGCSVQSHVEKDPSVNLKQYKTYSWIGDRNSNKKNDKPYKDFQETYLTDLVSQQLEKNGFVKANSNPDVLVDYDIMYENSVRENASPIYSGSFVRYFYNPYTGRIMPAYFPSRYMGSGYYEVPYKSGTVTINMVDPKSKKVIWQGWAETEVTRKKLNKDDINKIVKSIFKKMDVAKN